MPWMFGISRKRRWKDSVPITEHPNYAHLHHGEMDVQDCTVTDELLQELIADATFDGWREPER